MRKKIKNFLINLRNFNNPVRLIKENGELKSKNNELNKKVAEIEKQFGIIAHDLKNPFNGLLGLTELLESDYDELAVGKQKEFIHLIHGQTQKTFDLLDNLLNWSKLRLGKQPISLTNVSVKEIGDNVISLLQLNADEKQVSLNNDVPAEIIIYADINIMQTVIRNLVSNAIKFTESGGKVALSAITMNGSVLISVTDTGIGIKSRNLENLFAPEFYSTNGTGNESGSGLGLRICKGLIEEQGGTIFASSVLGKGTVITFSAKLARPVESAKMAE